MAQTCTGCTEGSCATLWRVGGAWLVGAMVLALVGHPGAAEQARRSPSDRIAAGRVSADWILLAARSLGEKPEPGSDRPSPAGRPDGGNGGGNGNGGSGVDAGSGAAPGNQTPAVAARPISTASQCDRAPTIDGQGGGLASDEQASVCYAVLALSRIGVDARTTYEALASQLYDSNPRYRKQAAEKIGQISGGLVEALPLLVDALGASDPRVQKTAAMIATDIREYARDVVPALERVARDQDNVVARAGVQSLVDLGPYVGKGLPTLAAALGHRDLGVRYFAGEGITRVDFPDADHRPRAAPHFGGPLGHLPGRAARARGRPSTASGVAVSRQGCRDAGGDRARRPGAARHAARQRIRCTDRR